MHTNTNQSQVPQKIPEISKAKNAGKSPGKNNFKMVLAVTYGHSTTVIGNINVNDDTNYVDAKILIIPLVRKYLNMDPNDDLSLLNSGSTRRNSPVNPLNSDSTGRNSPVDPPVNLQVNMTGKDYGESAQPCRNYGEEFVLLDPSGLPIDDPNIASVSLYIYVREHFKVHNLKNKYSISSEINTIQFMIHISEINLI